MVRVFHIIGKDIIRLQVLVIVYYFGSFSSRVIFSLVIHSGMLLFYKHLLVLLRQHAVGVHDFLKARIPVCHRSLGFSNLVFS